ncbi:Natterin-4 [Bienertia sinuspersici]
MAELVPRYIALGKGGKYLRYVLEDGELHSRMQLISDKVVGEDRSFTKLEIVSAESSSEDVALVHIRSCYNNKFLVLSKEVENWIVAGADEPEEDPSEWSCTLFRLGGNKNRLRLFLQAADDEHGVQIDGSEKCLTIARNSTSAAEFNVTDLASLAVLPRYVVFKGDNNKYMAARPILAHKRLKFNMSSPLNRRAQHEVVTLPNGNVRFRSLTYNKFWRNAVNAFIWCESNEKTATNDTTFQPVRLDSKGNTIAIKSLGNNKYCERNTKRGPKKLKGTLRASSKTVNPRAVLRVEEAIREREVYDVQYNIRDARIYDVEPLNNVVKTTNNFAQTNTAEKQLGFTYTRMSQETFTSTQSWKVKVSVEMKAKIPVLVQGKIRMDTTYQGSMQWSKTKETTEEISSSVTVQVPPMTKAVVTMTIGRGSIDVPFSYTQRDVLLDGRVVTNRLHDGLFSGLNTELIDYTIEEEPLSEEEARAAILRSKL